MAAKVKPINLALQGGGAHGAFAWGVLDKILEDGRLSIEGMSATSAGAMNACAYAHGKVLGGIEGARQSLHDLWWNVHLEGRCFNPVQRLPWEHLAGSMDNWNLDHSPAFFFFDSFSRMMSPYQWNPLDFNPLKSVLEKTVDFDAVVRCECTKLFISTTHVRSGKVRVFEGDKVTMDVALASACLPFLYKAVNIDGEDYWDGGYVGNPALLPLFYKTRARDILVVHINPLERSETPRSAPDIMNRINEVSFNSSLLQEMRAVAFVKKLIEHDMLKDNYKESFKDVLMHSLRADEAMQGLSVASKFDSDWKFLCYLRDQGRMATENWLEEHFAAVGERDTINLHDEFLHSVTQMFDEQQQQNNKKKVFRFFGNAYSA